VQARVDASLQNNADLLERFRDTVAGLFAVMAEGRAFKRRPNISLRLIADGGPPAKLVTVPLWSRFKKEVNCQALRCELLKEQDVQTPGGPAKNRDQCAAFSVPVGGKTRANLICLRTGVEDYARVLSTIRNFLDDRRGVLARSHDHCCICGRALTDGMSMARGIGPECIKWVGRVAFLGGPGLVLPEE
jgi:Family of unknown function (DUF6011)